jgi:hypothetical protein
VKDYAAVESAVYSPNLPFWAMIRRRNPWLEVAISVVSSITSSPCLIRTVIETQACLEEVTISMRAKKCQILCALAVSALLLLLPAKYAAQVSAALSTATNLGSAHLQIQEDRSFKLSPNALQVARIIGVGSDIARLSELTTTKNPSATPVRSLEELSLRQRITDAIVVASLDVDSVLDEMDYEREQIVELRSILRARRDRAIGTTNLAVLAAGTGLGVVGGVLSFSKTTSNVGNAIGFASGGISTLFSLRSYRQVHGAERPAWVLPNMLAAFLSRPEERHSHYPEDIWAYLNSVPPGEDSKASRKEQVVAEWITAGRMGSLDLPQSKQKIALLTSTDAADKRLDMTLLNERGAMLADVRDEVAQMKHDLADLLRALKQQ